MPSVSYRDWVSVRAAALDEIENAHRAVGGTGPGRRYATQQLNYAYAMLLSSQFQGFCRDLHSECIAHVVGSVTPAALRTTLADEFRVHRRLDRGNPNPSNLGADFNRLGIDFWVAVLATDARNRQRRQALDDMNEWRNAIAHQDFPATMIRTGRPVLHLSQAQLWRRACDGLARSFDGVMRGYIHNLTGTAPW
jgi:hypothetical protein